MSQSTVKRPSVGNLLLGRRLATEEAPHQTISKTIGLAVFASDALSSVAYATQEILIILSVAGTAYFGLSIPIAIIIIGLLIVLTISYRQTIYAYPGGGGAYIVARDNLGDGPALTAGAALLTDYILTVSVSISSGVAQIASAFPAVFPYRVELALALIALITIVNLRGVKESGTVFAVPTYFFVVSMLGMLAFGFWQQIDGQPGHRRQQRSLRTHHADADRLSAAQGLRQRLHRADRRRGNLQRYHGLQGAAQPQCGPDADGYERASWVSCSSASRSWPTMSRSWPVRACRRRSSRRSRARSTARARSIT